jgi:hypothetical protein
MRRLLAVITAVFLIAPLFLLNERANAECASWPTGTIALNQYDEVFVGRLVSITKRDGAMSQSRACFEIMQSWKGPTTLYEEVVFYDGPQQFDCEYPVLRICETYLVHVKGGAIGCCNPTRALSWALDEIQELGKPGYRNYLYKTKCEAGA